MKKRILSLAAAFVFAGMIGLPADLRGADAPATAPSTAPSADGVQRFYGAITAIDKDAQTFTVDNQVYVVVPETQMTKATDDSHATLADATVGEPARGTYTKAGDGKLHVTKVRFGKKTGGKAGGGKAGGKKKDAAAGAESAEPAAPAAPAAK